MTLERAGAAVELIDYIAFFEAEPTAIDPEVGWTCGATFASTRGDDRILARIAPDDAEFAFDWWQSGALRASIRINRALEWDLDCKPGKDLLRLTLQREPVSYFMLQLKPFISIESVVQ